MNYEQRRSTIINSNDGNHVNGEPPECEEEQEVEQENCEECGQAIDYREHYVNWGLCWRCIERIGK